VMLAAWVGTQKPPTPEFAYMSDRQGDWDIYAMDAETHIDFLMTVDLPTAAVPFNIIDDRYPAWSPDGQWLAYHSNVYGNWDLYIMDADGNQVRQITNDPADEAMPSWSPDGTRLAFHSTRRGNWDIFVLTIATGEVQQVTFFAGEDTFAAWSPDGRQLAYASDRDGDQEIYVRTALGDAPPEAIDGYSLRMLTDNSVDDWSPAWSPDGRFIAYVSEDTNGYGIMIMDAQEGATDPSSSLVTLDGGIMTNEWNPAWVQTSDGLSLMFVSNLAIPDSIYMVNISTCLSPTLNEDSLLDGALSGGVCRYSSANLVTTGGENPYGLDSRWSPDWRPVP